MSAVFSRFPSMAAGLFPHGAPIPPLPGRTSGLRAPDLAARFRLFKRAPLTSFGENCW